MYHLLALLKFMNKCPENLLLSLFKNDQSNVPFIPEMNAFSYVKMVIMTANIFGLSFRPF